MKTLGLLMRLAWATVSAMPAAGGSNDAFISRRTQTVLIELFTSEGCSSCPPAEAWLGGLREAPGLWTEFVPVAFHVDYWDRLGWRDRFARREFTQRQQSYAAAWKARSVYTPCLVRNGMEWHDRRAGDFVPPRIGILRLVPDGAGRVTATFAPEVQTERPVYNLAVALLGAGLRSEVRAGENAGRRLEHDFVALALQEVSMKPLDESTWTATVGWPDVTTLPAEPRAIAAWVTTARSPAPIQAAGGWLRESRLLKE